MRRVSLSATIASVILLLFAAVSASAQDGLNPAGAPRYGRQTLAAGFSPSPFTYDAVSGGDINVKSLNLGDNCLGYAASDPDFAIELSDSFSRITFLIASEEDTTLIINLPNGSWSCNDDSNGLNPALVYHDAAPGPYQIWIGSYAAETYDDSVLYVSEAGPEALPTTATGPEPGRDPLYRETSLDAGFQPSPFTVQFIGGGRNQAADFVAESQCRGYVSEAPDFSVFLSEGFSEVWFGVFSPADMMLLVNAADGNWHCSDAATIGANPGIGFSFALAGLYDVWVGSADERNYAASIFYVMEYEPDDSLSFTIDTSCDGQMGIELQVGMVAVVSSARGAGAPIHAVPETASTVIFKAAPGSSMLLVGGPVCDEEHRWWRVELGDGSRGWVADGDGSTRWLDTQN